MSRRSVSKLRPVPNGGVLWYVPQRKRAIAETTKASSDLVYELVSDGYTTFDEIQDAVLFDNDIVELCHIMRAFDMHRTELELVDNCHGVRFKTNE